MKPESMEWINQVLESPWSQYPTKEICRILIELQEEITRIKAELEVIKSEREDPLITLIELWVSLYPDHEVTSKELFLKLQELAESEGINFPYKDPRVMGQTIQRLWGELEHRLCCNYRTGTGNIRTYRFCKKSADFILIGGQEIKK